MWVVETMELSRFWKNCHGKSISSKGDSGGIATLVSSKFSIISIREINHWLLTEIQEKDDPTLIYIYNVYGPTHYIDKVVFWEYLSKIKENPRGKHLIIARYFNTTKS